LFEQSGIATPAEAEPRVAVTSAPVRLRKASGESPVFAACAGDERLVGGGCSGGSHCTGQGCAYLRSFPSSPDPSDTIGGRWNCHDASGVSTAHALCQLVR
jgi:hypothetical protein